MFTPICNFTVNDHNGTDFPTNHSTTVNKTIRFEVEYYFVSLSVAFYSTISHFFLLKTMQKRKSLEETRVTILKFILLFDMLHVYLQGMAIYFCNNHFHSVVWHIIRFLLHNTFIISVSLNPMITINQCMKVKYGLIYQKLIARAHIKRKIVLVIMLIIIIHAFCFLYRWETYLFAVVLSLTCLIMIFMTFYLLYVASRNPPANVFDIRRQFGVKHRKLKKSHFTKLLLFVILSILISRVVFSIRHVGIKINYAGIKTAIFFSCSYVIITPIIHVWTMPDLKFYLLKDFGDYKQSIMMWYGTKLNKNKIRRNESQTNQSRVPEENFLEHSDTPVQTNYQQ